MNIFSIFLFFILTMVVPWIVGTAFICESAPHSTDWLRAYVFGMLLMLSVFGVLSVVFTLAHLRFSHLCVLYSAILVLLCGTQMWNGRLFRILKGGAPASPVSVERKIVIAVTLGLMVLEIFLLVWFQSSHFGDNYFHTAAMTDAIESDYMWEVDPSNGWNPYVNIRYKLGGWDMFLAYLAKMCGMKAPMLCYTFLPMFAYPWFYMSAALLGHAIFEKDLYADYFLMFFAVLMLFGYHNMVEAQSYFSSMPWAGRSILYGICVFLMFAMTIRKFSGGRELTRQDMWEFFLLNFASLSLSLTSMLTLLPIEVGIYLLFCIKRRKLFSFWKIVFTLIPFALGAAAYAAEYLITLLYYIRLWL